MSGMFIIYHSLSNISIPNCINVLDLNQLNSNWETVKNSLIADDIIGSTFNKNFLNIDTSNKKSGYHQPSYFSMPANREGWTNYPSSLPTDKSFVGLRSVYWRSGSNIMVEIHEMWPVTGRIWTDFYNSGTWTGWKSITPT